METLLQDEILLSEDISFTGNNTVYRKDRHLSSALIMTEIDYMKANQDNTAALKVEHIQIYNDMKINNWTWTEADDFYSWCMGIVLGPHHVDT